MEQKEIQEQIIKIASNMTEKEFGDYVYGGGSEEIILDNGDIINCPSDAGFEDVSNCMESPLTCTDCWCKALKLYFKED